MKPTIEELEARIRTAVERAKQEGWVIAPHEWLDTRDMICCPLAAAIRWDLTTTLGSDWIRVAERLGASELWCWSFSAGFDGDGDMDSRLDPDAYALGQKFREELVEKP